MSKKMSEKMGEGTLRHDLRHGAVVDAAVVGVRGALGLNQEFVFVNTTNWTAKVLVEEDPESLRQVNRATFDVGHNPLKNGLNVGANANVYAMRGDGERPAQELLLMPGETKSALMKSSTVFWSAGFLENTTFKVFKFKIAIAAHVSEKIQILEKHKHVPDMRVVQADSLLGAIQQLATGAAPQQNRAPPAVCGCSNPNSPTPSLGGWSEAASSCYSQGDSDRTLPPGHMPASGRLEVFSKSTQKWVWAKLIGIAVDPSLTPNAPGSFLVEYRLREIVHKSIPPSDFAQCVRYSSL